jgi:hypothetical protein
MERSVGEHATESTQPCRKGAIRGNITALEAAYEEYEIEDGLDRRAARGDFEKKSRGRDCASGVGFRGV